MNRESNRKRIIQRVQTVNLSIDDIVPDPNQPRKTFVSDALSDLGQSLHETGQISPVVVRPGLGGKYMIIVGERRWRAAKKAGISDVECIVRHDIDDQRALEMQLAENSQREDIPPLEQAKALKNYLDEYKISQSELSRRTGIPQRTISDRLALLTLPASVHARIESGDIGSYEGVKIASLPPEYQEAMAEAVSTGKLSGRALENVPRLLKKASEKTIHDIINNLVSPAITQGPSPRPTNVATGKDKSLALSEADSEVPLLGKLKDMFEKVSKEEADSVISVLSFLIEQQGRWKQEYCPHLVEGVCRLWSWNEKHVIPRIVGALAQKGPNWWLSPSPLLCGMCTMDLDYRIFVVERDSGLNPLYELKEKFECECGSMGNVAAHIKCTKCGCETWQGWWPEEKSESH